MPLYTPNPSTWLPKPNFELSLSLAQEERADFDRFSIHPARHELEIAQAIEREKGTLAARRDAAQASHNLGNHLCAFGIALLRTEPLEEGTEQLYTAAAKYPAGETPPDLIAKCLSDRGENLLALARLLEGRKQGPEAVTRRHDALASFKAAAELHTTIPHAYNRLAVAECTVRTGHTYWRLAQQTGGQHHFLSAAETYKSAAELYGSLDRQGRYAERKAAALDVAGQITNVLADLSGR